MIEKLQERRNFIETPLHYLANLLDPRHQGKPLTQQQLQMAYNHFDNITKISEHENSLLAAFQSFQSKTGKLNWNDTENINILF